MLMLFYQAWNYQKKLLNWEPTTNIEDGIKKTVEWYKEYENQFKN